MLDICRRNQPDMLVNDRLSYFKDGDALYLNVLVPPMGDILLPGLRGKVRSATLLRTRKTIPNA